MSREIFAKAQAGDDHGLRWVQAKEVRWTGEGLRRQMGLEVEGGGSEGGWEEMMPKLQEQPREGAVGRGR